MPVFERRLVVTTRTRTEVLTVQSRTLAWGAPVLHVPVGCLPEVGCIREPPDYARVVFCNHGLTELVKAVPKGRLTKARQFTHRFRAEAFAPEHVERDHDPFLRHH